MQYRMLGKTNLWVSEIGLGTWALSGRGYGTTVDSESIATINAALDSGINFIDTADSYGNGHSEELIGKVLMGRNDKDTIVCTKFGWDFYDKSGIKSNLNRDYIFSAAQQSLQRLKREIIDLYLVHSQNPRNIIDYDVYNTLEVLRRDGKIRYFGLSISHHYDYGYLQLLKNLNWDVIEPKFNLLFKDSKNVYFDLCTNRGIGLIVREPLANGMLTGKYTKSSIFDKNDHRNGWSQEHLEGQIEMVDTVKKDLNISDSEMIKTSIKYILTHNAVSTVIPGMKNIDQLNENISSKDYDIDKSVMSYLEQN